MQGKSPGDVDVATSDAFAHSVPVSLNVRSAAARLIGQPTLAPCAKGQCAKKGGEMSSPMSRDKKAAINFETLILFIMSIS